MGAARRPLHGPVPAHPPHRRRRAGGRAGRCRGRRRDARTYAVPCPGPRTATGASVARHDRHGQRVDRHRHGQGAGHHGERHEHVCATDRGADLGPDPRLDQAHSVRAPGRRRWTVADHPRWRPGRAPPRGHRPGSAWLPRRPGRSRVRHGRRGLEPQPDDRAGGRGGRDPGAARRAARHVGRGDPACPVVRAHHGTPGRPRAVPDEVGRPAGQHQSGPARRRVRPAGRPPWRAADCCSRRLRRGAPAGRPSPAVGAQRDPHAACRVCHRGDVRPILHRDRRGHRGVSRGQSRSASSLPDRRSLPKVGTFRTRVDHPPHCWATGTASLERIVWSQRPTG